MGQSDEVSNEMSAPEPMYGSGNKEPLLKKYNIPIQHFDFAYIDKCTESKELEKILQVLRSGEEGYYPDLIKRTEERLSKIKPNSRYIRKLTRVLSKNEIDEEFSAEISDDLNSWLNNINKKNTELSQFKNTKTSILPQIRTSKESKEEKKSEAPKRIKSTDYAAWDKYDADTELLKMDLEEEKMKKDAEKLAKEKHKQRTVKFNEFATTAEASFAAQRENVIGSEYFKAGEYENALEHYTNSIVYFPSSISFANRGATHISLKEYQDAVADYIKALKYEPDNQEYLLQLGKSYGALGKWYEALDCAETVIKLNPNNKGAQKFAEKAQKSGGKCGGNRVRLSVTDVDLKHTKTLRKSILKKEEKTEIIPIPGSSKMCGPYYKVVRSDDPKVIKKEKEIINNYPKRMYMTNIEIGSDEENYECIGHSLVPQAPWTKGVCVDTSNNNAGTNKISNNFVNKSKKKISEKSRMGILENEGLTGSKGINIEDRVKKLNVRNANIDKSEQDDKVGEFHNTRDGGIKGIDMKNYVAQVQEDKSQVSTIIVDENGCNLKEKDVLRAVSGSINNISEENATRVKEKTVITLDLRQPGDSGTIRSLGREETNNNDIGGGGEPFINDNASPINTNDVNMPFSFIQAWQSGRRDDTYSGFASILRNLNIERITEVIGNKIDATILSEILKCLYRHFMVANEVEKMYSILANLCRLQRFGIVVMFLSANDKRIVQNLLEFLNQHGRDLPQDIKRQYM